MIPNRPFRPTAATAREKLLEAAVRLVRAQGFAATSVDQLCGEAGVTKGAFFHHFPSKEALGVAAAEFWSASTGAFFADAPFHGFPDPVDRVLGYIDLRIALIGGRAEAFSCVAGTMVQEAFRSSAAIRMACEASIMGNAAALEEDLAAAIDRCGVSGTTAASLSRHVQAVIQGAFILAKTQPEDSAADLAREQLGHLRRYFAMLFHRIGEEIAS
ncbi:TetR/AcrR family transcriptional regulator [Novosphingobium cyanobacteriorum]|uniref:TetR/AcrR family transcriptional regulator n=1 Tax=Novosphingobium cyanobacteriorum TaxID=3024215 RepID=A0ABT6CK40_9SPHN|nr:TetR/AcrR family transcriptional regulator [Novosphingobium cyanobacteriorum]MDF8334182.1 TetR/AcrR family transcriptional regulator [Novosphingobium cyanobacteriorum]